MKLNLFIDNEREEEIIIYAKEKTQLIEEIEELVANNSKQIIGFKDKEASYLNINDIFAFIVEDSKIFAITEKSRYLLKCRLYSLNETLPNNFVKISQSSIINFNKIKSFSTAISGTIIVNLTNGYTDFVSRRNIKNIKERLGL